MMWKPLLLKGGVLVCAAVLAVTLNLQTSLGTTDARILGRIAFQWDVRHPPRHFIAYYASPASLRISFDGSPHYNYPDLLFS